MNDVSLSGVPFQVRVTSIFNETITFPQSFTFPMPLNVSSSRQFSAPAPGYGGASASGCVWPGAVPEIFVDTFGGPPPLSWYDFGSTLGCASYF